jgi:DNA helicase HerA-like ATPase
MCKPGEATESLDKRVAKMGIENWTYAAYPVRFWDVYGKQGMPVRATISDMGPDLLSRIMELSDVQSEVLTVVFKIADDNQWLLIDTKDLRAMLHYVGENAKDFSLRYGNLAPQSIAAIQRNIVHLESNGGEFFFGEPALDIADWLVVDDLGHGIINLLHSVELVQNPLLYSTFLLWMLSELYEKLPEIGNPDKPKIVFFFDEAHLLFDNAPNALLQKIEQVVRLIRSKGVGIYFCTQSPADIPDSVLAQLGNKIQHALRAYTPKEQQAIRAAAQSFRPNPAFSTETVIGELGTGEALITLLDADGVPSVVERAKILPPRSLMGVAEPELIAQRIQSNPLYGKYATAVDNPSAYEQLVAVVERDAQAELEAQQQALAEKQAEKDAIAAEKAAAKEAETAEKKRQRDADRTKTAVTRVATNTVSTIGREISKSILRGLFGTRR